MSCDPCGDFNLSLSLSLNETSHLNKGKVSCTLYVATVSYVLVSLNTKTQHNILWSIGNSVCAFFSPLSCVKGQVGKKMLKEVSFTWVLLFIHGVVSI